MCSAIFVTDECSFDCSSRREIAQRHPGNKKTVYYRTPCNKRLVSYGGIAIPAENCLKKRVVGNPVMLRTVLISL